jgi:hypothetical protein
MLDWIVVQEAKQAITCDPGSGGHSRTNLPALHPSANHDPFIRHRISWPCLQAKLFIKIGLPRQLARRKS